MDTTLKTKRDWNVFLSSLFFVLGFSSVFSLLGILLQTLLLHSSFEVQMWLSRVGGIVIILFGLFLLRLFTPAFLERDHKFAVRRRFKSYFVTSFAFGAAFAVGWTPCVSAALGAILALAASAPTSAFLLLFSYTLGIGIPFLLVGLFVDRASALIQKLGKWLVYIEYIFGVFLIIIGILVFTENLSLIANFQSVAGFLDNFKFGWSYGGRISSLNFISIIIAFVAGLGSFLSPCILPIIPGFLSYLATTAAKNNLENKGNE